GRDFVEQVAALGMSEVLSTRGAPWQRAFIERVIGTVRRECLDHMIVVDERTLRRHLNSFVAYYHRSRTHLGLQKDAPVPRPVQGPQTGRIVALPEVGGLHHRYERPAA
ncbi:MAG TPA: integrase core domain-containing protein, partial [Vicinamibacterales bacterium]|nr:integrase core domain-containing protein [Vicinamibacterales bacterium]